MANVVFRPSAGNGEKKTVFPSSMVSGAMGLLKRIYAYGLIIILTLVLCEAGLRISGIGFNRPLIGLGYRTVELGPFTLHPTRFWCLTPAYEPTEVNAQGFRGPEISVTKPDNRYRIFCLGNSTTFGVGFVYKYSYSARLQEKFDAVFGAGRVEVVNAGVPGYSTLQELRYLKEDILKYDPDMVIVQYGENDREGGNNRRSFPSALFFRLQPFLLKFKVFRNGYNLYYGMKKYFYYENPHFRERLVTNSYRDCLHNLADMENCAGENGVDIFFITPVWFLQGELFRMDIFAKDPGIDIFKTLKASGADPRSLYIGGHHWFPAGHSLVASAIFETVYPAVLAAMKQRGDEPEAPDRLAANN